MAAPYWNTLLTPQELQTGAQIEVPNTANLPPTAYNPDGRYFISYRSVDGSDLADELQTRLRAAGLSAWRDHADLDEGEIRRRLTQAMTGTGPYAGGAGGLAGAVLIATPHVWTSEPVRHVEAPIAVELNARHQNEGFDLSIANAVPAREGGPADMTEVDAVYGLPSDTLNARLMHDATTVAGRETLARKLLEKRLERRIGLLTSGQPLRIHVNSRQPLDAKSKPSRLYGDSDLLVRLEQQQAQRRWPSHAALTAFAAAMTDLKNMVEDGVPVQLHGSIHPTIALGLGATFSARRPGQVIECLHEGGDLQTKWRSDAPVPANPRTFSPIPQPAGSPTGGSTLVMVIATCTPADRSAFDDLARQPRFRAIHRLELDSWEPINAGEGNDLARRLAITLTKLAAGSTLHLAFVGPWSLAVLLGHHLNAINYVAYEWDNSAEATLPVYQPSLRINAGVASHLTVMMPPEEDQG